MVSPEGIGGIRPEAAGEVMNAREAFENRTGVYEHAQFGREITAMITPFREDDSLNLDKAQELAQILQANGSEGLVLAGTTGEAPTLKFHEQMSLFREIREAVDIPILAGTGSNNTEEAVEMSHRVGMHSWADGLLVVSPYYNKPGQSGIEDYFSKVLRVTELPVVMYDIPGRTGRPIAVDTVKRLAERFENLVGIKDAAGDPAKSKQLLLDIDRDDFQIYSGDDSRNLELYRAGAVGAISVASHWAGVEITAMFDAVDARDYERAEAINRILEPSYDFETSEDIPNPIPTKEMMNALGLNVGRGRSPMVLGSEADYQALNRRALEVFIDLQAKMRALNAA